MSRRNIHVKKSDDEYKEYIDTPAQVSDTSHAVRDVETDATNRLVSPDEVPSRRSTAPARREPWLLEHWHTIWPAIIVSLILAVLSWYGSSLFKLNRESGIATANLAAVEREQATLAETIRRLEDRLEQELDALTLRVDRIVDTHISSPESGESK